MASQIKLKSTSKSALPEPQQWLEKAIEENHIRYFDYSHFKDFEYLGFGGFGKVEKAIYDFAGTQVPYALKTIFQLQDVNIGKKALNEFIREVKFMILLMFRYFLFTIDMLIKKISTAKLVPHS